MEPDSHPLVSGLAPAIFLTDKMEQKQLSGASTILLQDTVEPPLESFGMTTGELGETSHQVRSQTILGPLSAKRVKLAMWRSCLEREMLDQCDQSFQPHHLSQTEHQTSE